MSTTTKTLTLPSNIMESSRRETIRNAVFEEPSTPPEYECCFGTEWPPRVKGWTIWDLKPGGTAEKLWNSQIFSYTKDLVNNIRTDVEVDAAIHAWMIGKNETRARPTVVLFSTSEKFRRDARRVILRSGFLTKYKFGVMTLSAAISKDSKRAIFVTDPEPRALNQLGIRVSVQPEDGKPWRVSTSGGILRFSSDAYYFDEDIRGLTVAHVFDAGEEVQDSVAEFTELAFDEYDSDDESSTSLDVKNTIRSHDSSKLASFVTDTQDPHTKFTPPQPESKSVELPSYTSFVADVKSKAVLTEDGSSGSPVMKQLEHLGFLEDPPIQYKEHDWALFDLDPRLGSITDSDILYSEENVPIYGKSTMLASEVWVAISRDSGLQGRGQSSLCAIKTKGSAKFVDVWVVQLCQSYTIGPGDCGSWVHSNYHSQPQFIGMVISTCSSLDLSYLIPAKQIAQDLQNIFSKSDIQFYWYMDLPFEGRATSQHAVHSSNTENEDISSKGVKQTTPAQSSSTAKFNPSLIDDSPRIIRPNSYSSLGIMLRQHQQYLEDRSETAAGSLRTAPTFDKSPVQSIDHLSKGSRETFTVWMGELDSRIDKTAILSFWAEEGIQVAISTIKDGKGNNGYCFVELASREAAEDALALDGSILPNTSRPIKLKLVTSSRLLDGHEITTKMLPNVVREEEEGQNLRKIKQLYNELTNF